MLDGRCADPRLPCVKGDSSRCEEMSRSDRGDRRRQRLPSEARLRERKGKAFMYLKPFSPSVTTYAVPPSRLPPRSVLLLRRGVRRTPAPSRHLRLYSLQYFLSRLLKEIADEIWFRLISSLPSRSAIVLAIFKIRSYALADIPSLSNASCR